MGKPHPIELRERLVAFVNDSNSNREAARLGSGHMQPILALQQ